jgi:hypothetical protein
VSFRGMFDCPQQLFCFPESSCEYSKGLIESNDGWRQTGRRKTNEMTGNRRPSPRLHGQPNIISLYIFLLHVHLAVFFHLHVGRSILIVVFPVPLSFFILLLQAGNRLKTVN